MYTDVYIVIVNVKIKMILAFNPLKWGHMHQFFGDNISILCNGLKFIQGTEIAMAITKCIVHLCYEGTGLPLFQGDPEANWVELKPQKLRLGE
ncbi:hypothetical protein GCM10008927_06530 [Amylibacter ulvae]|uniref:Uncharacterized protein n=1 Tax=Paramylibacter ulvae TaxID=1651968 RepID=A0ABQ3CUC5_9RHOB|nr:hypothetical protein GCM10008927_06530 [Amylibacter ulvae]